jgi:hypothetical protein
MAYLGGNYAPYTIETGRSKVMGKATKKPTVIVAEVSGPDTGESASAVHNEGVQRKAYVPLYLQIMKEDIPPWQLKDDDWRRLKPGEMKMLDNYWKSKGHGDTDVYRPQEDIKRSGMMPSVIRVEPKQMQPAPKKAPFGTQEEAASRAGPAKGKGTHNVEEKKQFPGVETLRGERNPGMM